MNPMYDEDPDLETTVESSPGGSGSPEPSAGATALLPRTFLGDTPKPGDTLELRVTHVYEDEVAVCLCESEPAETEESEPEAPEPGAAEDQGLYL